MGYKKKICIIIPAYNEEDNLVHTTNSILKNNLNKFIIVIIDDSKKSFKKKLNIFNRSIYYIHRKNKKGRGSAVLHGLNYSIKKFDKVNTFIEMDADMSHNPNELIKNISIFKKKKLDLLISSRYLRKSKIINWPIKRKFFSFLVNKLSKFLLRVPVSDYTNGYRIYSKKAASHIINNCGKIGDGYVVLSEILIQIYYNNFKISETESVFINRTRGVSNVNLLEIYRSFIGLLKIFFLKNKLKKSNYIG